MDRRLPGLATPEEKASLSTLPAAQMNEQFLHLMTRYHQGGLVMAETALEREIFASQQAEITHIEQMLASADD